MNKPNLGALALMNRCEHLCIQIADGVRSLHDLRRDDKFHGIVYDPDTLDKDLFEDCGMKVYDMVRNYRFDDLGNAHVLLYDSFSNFGGRARLVESYDEFDDVTYWCIEIYFDIGEDDPDFDVFDEDYAKIVIEPGAWGFDYD